MSRRVLLCDDEIHIIRAAEFKFQRAGWEVELARDGEEAWQAIGRRRPDLVITDFQMPRLNGLALCERIRSHAQFDSLPLVLLTAKGFELDAVELIERLRLGAVVAKPFSPRELLARANALLGEENEGGTPSESRLGHSGTLLAGPVQE